MTVAELQQALHLYLLTPQTDGAKQIDSVFCCDLLSLAMGRAPAGCAWVTVMGNLNTIAVATLADVGCIVLAEGVTIGPDCIARAVENNIPVFTTAKGIFETAKAIDALLLILYCDLHLHSCLSPCGDEDMTPNNIVNMAALKGLHCIALTDHNTCGNCRSTQAAARRAGLGFLPGMELTTAEDIHAVCLFPDCDSAEAFSAHIYGLLPPIPNKPRIFGEQTYRDENDTATGNEERLLITATSLSVVDLEALVARYGGLCFPAHIDKDANGILSILGAIPEECAFPYAEVSTHYAPGRDPAVDAALKGRQVLCDSDAHYLWDISEAERPFRLGDDPLSRMIVNALREAELPLGAEE